MPYATGRVYFDADSHVMEPADWIIPFADPDIRPRLKPAPPWEFDNAKARAILEERAADEQKEERARGRLMATGTMAYGAWDATERSKRSICSASRAARFSHLRRRRLHWQ